MLGGINGFPYDYLSGINLVKDKKGELRADSRSVSNSWMNNFGQLLNVHEINQVTRKEKHTVRRLVPKSRAFKVEMAIEKLREVREIM
jgi:hypothetical protein